MSPIANRNFIYRLGFDDNPFTYTNADKEERLPDYFIPPQYFDSVFGNPDTPQSFIVFAPRGGGKSAQRRMIELKCADNQVLAITYDRFEYSDITQASDIKLHHHLRKILRFSLLGLLFSLNSRPEFQQNLTKHDRQVFLKLAAEHLGGINEYDLEIALNSLKSFKDRFKDFWNEWLPVIEPGLRILLKMLKPLVDIGDIDALTTYQDSEFKPSQSLKYQLKLVVGLANKLGWKAIYILIDRVDEAELTGNNFKDSFQMLEPLLKDLELLEFGGVGFKFFLWDMLQPLCDRIVRTDRINQETLQWNKILLSQMWEKRLQAYSRDKISNLNSITHTINPSLDELALIFANYSPRDMIRIGAKVLAEQQELNPVSNMIEETAVYRGIEKFCDQRVGEIITKDRILRELRKVRQVDFTIPYLANQIFREDRSSTRSRMQVWREQEAIIEVERIDDPNSKQLRPVKLFAIKDIRVAKEIYPELDIPKFLEQKYRRCPNCDATVLRDWGEQDSSGICHDCQFDLMKADKDSLDTWRRNALATQRRKAYKEETLSILEGVQLSFDFNTEEKK